MLIERMRKRLSADRTSFIEPCLPSPADKPPSGSTGFMKSSTTATGSWPDAILWASGWSPEEAWLAAAGISYGAIFRSVKKGGAVGQRLPAQSVANIVKIYAERVGLDPALFAGHSMRSGFLTSAAKRGASIFKMMDQSPTDQSKRCAATSAMPKSSRSTRAPACCDMSPR
jgi:hypothetical protein